MNSTTASPLLERDCTRLYISPFTPDLFAAVIPRSVHKSAAQVSYHTPQTFPENTFGYVTIPASDATKLKSKLHGAILRGLKMRVEDARPERTLRRSTRQTADPASEDPEQADVDLSRKSKKKRAVRHAVVTDGSRSFEGIELSPDRTVKRGSADKKKSKRAHSEDHDSAMVFRTKIPLNARSSFKSSKQKRKDKSSSKSNRIVEVTEFANTETFPSFIRNNDQPATTQRTSEFIEGRGWVDQAGNLIEEAVVSQRKRRRKDKSVEFEQPQQRDIFTPDTAIPSKEVISTTTSVSQPDTLPLLASDDTQSLSVEPRITQSITPTPLAPHRSHSTELAPSLEEAKTEQKEIHPLEALFKRPAPKTDSSSKPPPLVAPRPAPIKTSFSFFSSDDGSEEPVPSLIPPQTPFTRQDIEMRGVRSAAPTPDTAAIGERFRMPWRRGTNESESSEDDDDDEDNDENEQDPRNENQQAQEERDEELYDKMAIARKSASQEPSTLPTINEPTQAEQNDFEKQFWQNRAEYNRAWKTRKKDARKQARQAENRRRGGLGRR